MKKIITILAAFLLIGIGAPAQQKAHWLELPSSATRTNVHTVKADIGGQTSFRSFTFAYFPEERISHWVAYPLNGGLIGEGSRGDGWVPSPDIPAEDQPELSRGFKYGGGYDRGHQIPSADRLDPKANEQTFTFVNATPQLHDFNAGLWAEFEKVVRTWAKRSDTLYVVTGAVPGKKTLDDNAGRPVNVPAAYWKVVLRRNTDKYGRLHWSMNAVYLPHMVYNTGTWQENLLTLKKYSMSVDVLESLTGLDFFPYLSEIIGKEAADRLEAENPAETDWWWK